MQHSNSPIGIFDSGIGGTSIWKEIVTLLPNEKTIYLSDSKNAPYGTKSKESIIELSKKNTEFLLNKGCKLIVVACNTATTNAIQYLRASYPVPFIGIEPAIKPASIKTKTNIVGVLATKGTLTSELFAKTSSILRGKTSIKEVEGEGLVELIEAGKIKSKEMENLLTKYLNPLLDSGIDCLVLGCTHYPYLIPEIKKIIGNKIQIIDSGQAVARQTKAVLQQHKILTTSTRIASHQFFINKEKNILETIISNSLSIKNNTINQLDF